MVRRWLIRYFSYCGAAIVAQIIAIASVYLLLMLAALVLLPSNGENEFSSFLQVFFLGKWVFRELGFSQDHAHALAGAMNFTVGLAFSVPVYRFLAGFGWKRPGQWRYIWLGYVWFAGIYLLTSFLTVNWITTLQALIVNAAVVLTFGFGWHVCVQRLAEAQLEAKKLEADVSTFA